MTRALEFRSYKILRVVDRDGEGNECRRNVDMLEGAGHRVLSSDRRDAELALSLQSSEQSRHRLAPALRVVSRLLEILLESEIYIMVISSRRDELCRGLDDRKDSAVIRALRRQERVEAVCHERGRVGLAGEHRDLRRHVLRFGDLVLSAVRHHDGARADRAVKFLDKSALGADIERSDDLSDGVHPIRRVDSFHEAVEQTSGIHALDLDIGVLLRAVRVQELAGEVDYVISIPLHAQARLFGHVRDNRRLEILAGGVSAELLRVLLRDDDSHSLLRLGNRELGAVETLVLLRNLREVDIESVREFTDSDRNSARAEIVAALDESRDLLVPEQSLELSLLRRVALLNLRTAGCQRGRGVCLRGTGSSAAAVASGASAEQDYLVAGDRALTHDVLRGSRADDGADLEVLRDIIRMIELINSAGSETDLVAVGRISARRAVSYLRLRELARQRLGNRNTRVGASCDAHRLIDIRASGQRVADRAAKAGSRAAERLDLGRMVVRLVLEHEEPILGLAVDVDLDLHRAGVDLLGLIEVLQHAGLL